MKVQAELVPAGGAQGVLGPCLGPAGDVDGESGLAALGGLGVVQDSHRLKCIFDNLRADAAGSDFDAHFQWQKDLVGSEVGGR